MARYHILVLFLGLVTATGALDVEDVVDVLKLGKEVITGLFRTWKLVDELKSREQPDPSFLNKGENHVLTQIAQTGEAISRVEEQIHSSTAATISSVLRDIPGQLRTEILMHELEGCISHLNRAHAQLQKYVRHGYDNETQQWHLERHTLEDLATAVVSHNSHSVRQKLERIQELITGEQNLRGTPALLPTLAKSLGEANTQACNMKQSPQQMLYNLHNTIALTELKGYTMMQFSWMLLRLYNKGNFSREAELMRDTYEEQTQQKVAAVSRAMKGASRQLWQCDPRVHVEGQTYVQLTKLLQGHIQNEVDMNREHTCRENCQYYSYAQSTGCFDKSTCSTMKRCNGRLLDCQYFDSDMWICQGDRKSGRRYEWIEYENGKTLGRRGTCPSRQYKVDSWWRWLFWHCSYCFCLCDEQGPESDRYFNLRPVLADVANNKVVTGLRFVKINRVIHLQIQEGGLLPHGNINASSLQWRPVDDYKITDSNVRNERDYHTLSWEQRAIDLDDLEAPPGHVLTGVRFRNVGTHLNPEIMVTPLNFTAGVLIKPQEKSMWLSNDNTDASLVKPRMELKLSSPDVPTNSHVSSVPDSQSDQYMLFTHSDLSMDAAQTTVPFLDAQPVAPDPPTILSGAGIFHKGTKNYGGFIAPKVFTYDMAMHLSSKAK
ncbi:uncharacterized protein orion [Anabrus simplex]|uniref:uncharacterized protein orion n=1 Tax=Anabrus simplex TaxID=316456 RepID=UPI0034DD25AF